MKTAVFTLLASTALLAAAAWCQSGQREPHIGYVYPAGGQEGTVFHVMVGGQYLGGKSSVHVTGEGVGASVVRYMGRVRRLNGQERRELRRRLQEVRERLQAESFRDGGGAPPPAKEPARRGEDRPRNARDQAGGNDGQAAEGVKLPSHPLLDALDDLSLEELEFVENEYLRADNRKQPNAQIAETVLIEIAIEPGAPPGDREIRLRTPAGLTNPLCFQVGLLPEIREPAPYDRGASPAKPVDLPVLLNGQIKPGDIDRFRFRALQGQQLVIEASARHLIPYLADAVPGWFQATLALYDAGGNEVAFADDFRFHPDPVLLYEILETGVYELEIRDSIYRGREDFVYRIAVGELPFITSMFPLGGRIGGETVASIRGWNLPEEHLALDTEPGAGRVRQTALRGRGTVSNLVTYAADTLPECCEIEPNDTRQAAQKIDLPLIVNGLVAAAGDEDLFRFRGNAGDEIVAEVHARRLHSPLDSLLRLTDAKGNVLAWNDDHTDRDDFLHRDMGSITHHADSYLRARLPRAGIYLVSLADTQNHGGEAYAYRLRISHPRPDFALRVTPSSLGMRDGLAAPVCVHVLRKDGFDGGIELKLKNAPPGFEIQGATIPGGRDRVRMTLTAPQKSPARPIDLHLEGHALINGRTVVRPAAPSDDMMQAFLYRHLMPSRELVVSVSGGGRLPHPELAGDAPVRIPAGGTALVRIDVPRRARLGDIQLELNEPPEGLILRDVAVSPGGLTFVLGAGADAPPAGFADNLIVEAFTMRERRGRKGEGPIQKQRIPLGVLPAIPFEVVKQ